MKYVELLRASEKSLPIGALWNKKFVAGIQSKMLIYQSKTNLDEKVSFSKIIYLEDSKIR